MESKRKRKERGITLIALVITIIVLLILAGVSIAMLTGQNGILTQAQNARNETEKASVIEQARLDILEKQTEKYEKETRTAEEFLPLHRGNCCRMRIRQRRLFHPPLPAQARHFSR